MRKSGSSIAKWPATESLKVGIWGHYGQDKPLIHGTAPDIAIYGGFLAPHEKQQHTPLSTWQPEVSTYFHMSPITVGMGRKAFTLPLSKNWDYSLHLLTRSFLCPYLALAERELLILSHWKNWGLVPSQNLQCVCMYEQHHFRAGSVGNE